MPAGLRVERLAVGDLSASVIEPLWTDGEVVLSRGVGIPDPIAAIVLKLLSKSADDRYQTAAGVEADLRSFLAAWESAGSIEPFVLGQRDVPDQLRLPGRLYGREHATGALMAAGDAVRLGRGAAARAAVRPCRHRQVLGRARAACGARPAPHPVRLREVRPVQA